jgi:type III restriction enzyme
VVEGKSSKDVDSTDVKEKAKAAKLYCDQASEYATEKGGKDWRYVIIPHDRIMLSSSLVNLLKD